MSERSLFVRRTATTVLSCFVLSFSFMLMYLIELASAIFENLCQGPMIDEVCNTDDPPLAAAAATAAALNLSTGVFGNSSGSVYGLLLANMTVGMNATNSTAECICSEALLEYSFLVSGTTFAYLKTSVVLVGEIVLVSMLTYFVDNIERHPSVDAMRSSLFSKMLLVEFINTAAIMFLVSANSINMVMVSVLKLLGVQVRRRNALHEEETLNFHRLSLWSHPLTHGHFSHSQAWLSSSLGLPEDTMEISPELEAEWFGSVGVSYTMAISVNIVVTHIKTLIGHYKSRFNRRWCWQRRALQEDLHELFRPPELGIIERSVHLVNNIMCALFLSGSMPVLMPIVLIDMIFQYTIDRLWFHRVYAIPPYFSGQIASEVTHALFLAIPFHCLLTTWAFCKPYLQSDTHTLFDMFVEVSTNATETAVRRQLRKGGGGGGAGGAGETLAVESDQTLFELALTREATLLPLLLLLLTLAKPPANVAVPGVVGLVRMLVLEPLMQTFAGLARCVVELKKAIQKCRGKEEFDFDFNEEVNDHPKAGKKWSQDIVGKVREELSTFDLTKHLVYGAAFGPGMTKQTITATELFTVSEHQAEADTRKSKRRLAARTQLRRQATADAAAMHAELPHTPRSNGPSEFRIDQVTTVPLCVLDTACALCVLDSACALCVLDSACALCVLDSAYASCVPLPSRLRHCLSLRFGQLEEADLKVSPPSNPIQMVLGTEVPAEEVARGCGVVRVSIQKKLDIEATWLKTAAGELVDPFSESENEFLQLAAAEATAAADAFRGLRPGAAAEPEPEPEPVPTAPRSAFSHPKRGRRISVVQPGMDEDPDDAPPPPPPPPPPAQP